ncbi:DOT1-domain-containing protein [Violaceomyces palustris]|uniref:DOT1-domain-containing protein n=1 Tax=Violaceomyces palustris TaxID=1673888 RepID=A0ACD0NZ00_9BASI|nr:DOT1-domain-containing protein [Violaceomyces palustris]
MLDFFQSAKPPKASTPSSSATRSQPKKTPNSLNTSSPLSSSTKRPTSSKPSGSAATPSPLAGGKGASSRSKNSPVVVVTTVRKAAAPSATNSSNSSKGSSSPSGSHPAPRINSLPEEKRRRIAAERAAAEEERLRAEREKRRAQQAQEDASKKASRSKPISRSRPGSSRSGSVTSDGKKTSGRKRAIAPSSDEETDDDDLYGKRSRSSRAPSTPSGSKRQGSDPLGDAYQKLGREGVAPSYSVPRDIFNGDRDVGLNDVSSRPIQSAEIISNAIKNFGPFFNGLGDFPRATLEYPGWGASEEYLLLVPKDPDEYDPIYELLLAVKAIVTHYLTPEQRKLFGSLDSLELSGNAGMILPGANVVAPWLGTSNLSVQAPGDLSRARSADIPEKSVRRGSVDGLRCNTAQTPSRSTTPASRHAHTAPVSPLSGSNRTLNHEEHCHKSPAKAAILANANLFGSTGDGNSTPLSRSTSPPLTSPGGSSASATENSLSAADPDPILRSFAKARNRRDGPLFLRTLARFNAEIVALREAGAFEENLKRLGEEKGVPEMVWRAIQDQVYARTVGPRVEELGKYQAFSDNVYGELLPRFMSEIAQLTSLGPSSVFVDLGSGVGNLLLQTSLQTGCEAYGCEMMPVPSSLAQKQVEEAQKRWKMWALKGGKAMEAWEGDFGESLKVREILRRADVVLVNNYAFLPKTNENLSLLFLDLKDGASIVSLKPFVPPDFRLTERTLSSPLAILRVVERNYTSGCVSWADGGGKYYIQTVDRSLVRSFVEREEERGKSKRIETSRRRWKARLDDDDEVDGYD